MKDIRSNNRFWRATVAVPFGHSSFSSWLSRFASARRRLGADKAAPSILVFILVFTFSGRTFANEGALLQRIIELEKRVVELEARLAPVLEQERVKGVVKRQAEIARERALMDAEFHSRDDLNLIEKAYLTANKDWKSEEAGNAVAFLIAHYPRANRTGCAVLTRAQSLQGDEQLKLLKQSIEEFGGCYYSNGVQVGPYARLYLAMRHMKNGDEKTATKLFKELRDNYSNAIDHKGQLLTSHFEGMEQHQRK